MSKKNPYNKEEDKNKDKNINYPHNLAIEQAVIGTILNSNISYDKISSIIKYNDFFEEAHQIIYSAISNRLEAGQMADVLTLMNYVSVKGVETEYLISLSENPYPSESIVQYASLLAELSTRRKLINIGTNLIEKASGTEEIETQISFAEQSVFNLHNIANIENNTVNFYTGAKRVITNAEKMIGSGNKISGLHTGFNALDEILGGYKPGELIVIAGRPSMGKTALSTNMCVKTALSKEMENGNILFVSIEMPYDQICLRIISHLSKIPINSFTQARITSRELSSCMQALSKFRDMPFLIHDASFMNLSKLRSLLRHQKRQNNIKLVVIDYLQLIEDGKFNESKEQEISNISRAIKLLAKELLIPIVVLSQMSRDIEKRKESNVPKLSDLRGSGAIEQNADVIMFIYRKNEEIREEVTLMVAKNRNGPLGEIPLFYEGFTTTFIEGKSY